MKSVVQNHKWVIAAGVIFVFLTLHPFNTLGQNDPALSDLLQVGVMWCNE